MLGNLRLWQTSVSAEEIAEIERRIDLTHTLCVSVVAPTNTLLAATISCCLSKGRRIILGARHGNLDIRASNADADILGEWAIAVPSSGSTGEARYYGYSRSDMLELAAIYKRLYQVDGGSLMITALPAWYNFVLVACICVCGTSGARLSFCSDLSHIGQLDLSPFRRLVIVGNPVSLLGQKMQRPQFGGEIMIDSGGAPLGVEHIRQFRLAGFDAREGYGLTETLSLTHFDCEGSETSIGTVGKCMPFASNKVAVSEGAPLLSVKTKFQATNISDGAQIGGDRLWLATGDLASIDSDRRVRLLGRRGDICINGYWPKDTIDWLSEMFPGRAFLVQHLSNGTASIRSTHSLSLDEQARLLSFVTGALRIGSADVLIDASSLMLHSQKLPRLGSREAR
jgi:AMP-binding enzyme